MQNICKPLTALTSGHVIYGVILHGWLIETLSQSLIYQDSTSHMVSAYPFVNFPKYVIILEIFKTFKVWEVESFFVYVITDQFISGHFQPFPFG